jgi:histone H3/H4
MIEPFARIFRQKSQDKVSILLQHRVSPPVAPVSFGVSQMLLLSKTDFEKLMKKDLHRRSQRSQRV